MAAETKPSPALLAGMKSTIEDAKRRPQRTSEIQMAEEAALVAFKQLHAFLSGKSTNYKEAVAAQKTVNKYMRLLDEENRQVRAGLSAARALRAAARRKRA